MLCFTCGEKKKKKKTNKKKTKAKKKKKWPSIKKTQNIMTMIVDLKLSTLMSLIQKTNTNQKRLKVHLMTNTSNMRVISMENYRTYRENYRK